MSYDRAVHAGIEAAPRPLAPRKVFPAAPYLEVDRPEVDRGSEAAAVPSRLRLTVLGVRGFPNVQGGVETHAEQLYVRLARLGCDVEVLVRSPFVPAGQPWLGSIRLRRLWCPTQQGFEAMIHSVLGVLYAGVTRPDVLHIHAIGPSIVVPLARLLGLRVIVTHHGPDYDRDKWGRFARWVLRTGERFGMRYAHARIAISRVIVDLVRSKYGSDADLIRNGVVARPLQVDSDQLRRFGLEPGRYFLHVGRMVPEKRQLDLIAAYAAARPPGWKLVLAGALYPDDYCRSVKAASEEAGVVLAGFQSGVALEQLYTHAGAFVLPSSHEGLPIAMLEALSYGLPVVASDIPANLEVGLDPSNYVPVGDRAALASRLLRLAQTPVDPEVRAARRQWTIENFDWDRIAEQTLAVYRRVARR